MPQSPSQASARKMAEVRQTLSGFYRLITLEKLKSPPVVNGPNGCQLASYTLTGDRYCGRVRKETCPGIFEYQKLSKSKGEELFIQRKRRQDKETHHGVLCFVSSVPGRPTHQSSRLFENRENTQTLKTQLYTSQIVQPLLHASLMAGRMTCWSRNRIFLSGSFHAEALMPSQPLREFSTFTFTLAEKGTRSSSNGLKWNQLKCHPDSIHLTVTRCYSTTDKPLLYRSRTAYYDILSVSPNATHSQIKTAYYKQSFINHPDKNPGNEMATQRFSEISEAYMVLGNVGLRRKYDRGMLSQSDVQGAGRPSSGETSSRATGSHFQQQFKRRPRNFSQAGGKAMFDFDAFYQAHYGEQLQRKREVKARREMLEEKQKEQFKKWRLGKILDMTVGMLLVIAGVIVISINRP